MLDELIRRKIENPLDSATSRVWWHDVLRWHRTGPQIVNEEFPDFFEDQITIYRANIERRRKSAEEAAIREGGALVDPGPYSSYEEAYEALDRLEVFDEEDDIA